MKELDNVALSIAKHADGIGCCCATQAGEMPKYSEVLCDIYSRASTARHLTGRERRDQVEEIAALAVFLLYLIDSDTRDNITIRA